MRKCEYTRWTDEKKAKEFATNVRQDYGMLGGWIHRKNGKIECQGWINYYNRFYRVIDSYIERRAAGEIDKYGKPIAPSI